MIKILTTESGGAASVGLIKSIRDCSYDARIYAADSDELAAGNYLSDESFVVPRASEEGYIDCLLKLVRKHKINIIIPTGEHDLLKLSQSKERFELLDCEVVIADPASIIICQDKFKFYEFLKDLNIPLPVTFNKPMIVKPNKGSGSRGIEVMPLKGQIMQEYLSGKEYTVDVFSDMGANIINHVVRERLGIKAGISVKGRVTQNEKISSIVKKLVAYLNLKGASCIQFRENEEGEPVLIECNPRLGGGTYISTLAGVNYADLYFDLHTGVERNHVAPKEITVVRYYDEIVL
tara:strand:- start:577 stop:1452 length:876 start_codon:yes stop_codon:yes gene_type:complete